MAVDVAKLAIQLEAQGAEAVIGQLEGLGTAARSLASVVAASAVAFEGLEKSMDFLKESVDFAAEEEQVYTRMGVAVTNAGVNFATARPAIEALLESLSDKSTFRVDQLGVAFTRLVQLTGNVGGSMQMLGIVTDFAAGRNIDLETAANLVGKAMNGNATQLNRQLGLHGDAAQAIAVLTERYKGNAEALADTMGGAQAKAGNEMHELQEAIGSVIAKEGGLQSATLSWRDVLKETTTWVKEHREAIGNLVATFINFATGVGAQVVTIIKGMALTWAALNIAVAIAVATVKDIGPAYDLMISHVVAAEVRLLQTLANLVPGLHTLLDSTIQKFNAYAVTLANDANVALAQNKAALVASIDALKAHKDATEGEIPPIKDNANAHKQTTEELYKEAEALVKLAELHALSGPEFVKLEADYAKLTALVASHTLSLENQAKAEKILEDMRKAAPLLAGPSTVIEPLTAAKAKQTVDQGLLIYQKAITDGLIKSEAADKKLWKDRSTAFWGSAKGEFEKASQSLADSIQKAVMTDFVNLSADLAGTITDTLGAAFKGGFAAAGKQALQGLGNILASMGKHMMIAGAQLIGLLPALSNPFTSGPAMLAVGAILLATGTLLGGILTGSGAGGGGGGGASSIAGAGTANGAATTTMITLNGTGATRAGAVRPAQPIHVGPVIGPNDGRAQRDIMELISRGLGRGIPLGPQGVRG